MGSRERDVPYDIAALQDLNKFPDVVDRLQQGVLNTLYLGRLMRNSDGFATDPAFQNGSSQPLFEHRPHCTTTATARAGSWAA